MQIPIRNCAPITKYITKVDGTTIDDAEDLDLVIPMYNLKGHSSNYSETAGSLWFYSKDEAFNFNVDIANTNSFKSFKYNTKLLGNTFAQDAPNQTNGIVKSSTIAVPLKYLNSFWRSLEMPLINCKINLKLKWTKYCVFCANDNDNDNANNIIFTIKDTKLYISSCNFISNRQSKTIKNSFQMILKISLLE